MVPVLGSARWAATPDSARSHQGRTAMQDAAIRGYSRAL
jgi:hypothetical protein